MNTRDPVIFYLLSTLLPIAIKFGVYYGILKWRTYNASVLTCILLGSALVLPSAIVPLPPLMAFVAGMGVAVYILSQYTDTPIVPDGLMMIFGIEIGYAFVERLLLTPLIYE